MSPSAKSSQPPYSVEGVLRRRGTGAATTSPSECSRFLNEDRAGGEKLAVTTGITLD